MECIDHIPGDPKRVQLGYSTNSIRSMEDHFRTVSARKKKEKVKKKRRKKEKHQKKKKKKKEQEDE